MKKLLLACALSLLSWNANAGCLYLAPDLVMQQTTSHTDNFRGLHPKMAIGYRDIFSYIFVAGEIFIIPFTGSLSESENFRPLSVRTTSAVGASFLPGLYLSENIIAYMRVGLIGSRFYSTNTTESGPQLGFGLESKLTANWSMRFEYTYTGYESITYIGSPNSDEFGIGLVYRLE